MSIRNGLLALLGSGPAYGFQLKKEFEEATADFWPLNVGQVYTTLARLVRDGLVVEEPAGEGSGGDEGDASTRRYRLSGEGRAAVDDWLAAPRRSGSMERDELTIKVAVAVATGHDDVRGLIQAQRSETTSALQQLTRRKARLDPADVGGAIVLDAAIARLDAELRWLDLTEARLGAAPARRARPSARTDSRRRSTR